jgi:type IV pilus assembly protein PilC
MATFSVDAVDAKGKRIQQTVSANSAAEAITKAKGMGLKPIKVNQAEDAAPPGAGGPGGTAGAPPAQGIMGKKPGKKPFLLLGGRVSSKQLTQFTQQFSILLDAGLPVVRSLKILATQMKPGLLKVVVEQVSDDVESGNSLSEALAKHPKAYNRLYVNMVKAGEAGGVLDTILQRLAAYMEKAEALKRKVVGASIYPVVVITVAVLILTGIMIWIIPTFKKVFADLGTTLPTMTELLMQASNLVVQFWFLIPIVPVALIAGVKTVGRTRAGRLLIDRFKIRMPLFGVILRKAVIARFCRTLGTLLQSGVPILDALNIVKNAVGNEVVAAAITDVHDSIREGESIAGPLAQSRIFDDIVINMIDVGEETGELDKMLIKVANNYDDEVDAAVGGLVSILEPVMIVGLGGTIGFIVVALFLPLVSLIDSLQGGGRK